MYIEVIVFVWYAIEHTQLEGASLDNYYEYIDMSFAHAHPDEYRPVGSGYTPEMCAQWCDDVNNLCASFGDDINNEYCYPKPMHITFSLMQVYNTIVSYGKKDQEGFIRESGVTCNTTGEHENDIIDVRTSIYVYSCGMLCKSMENCRYFTFEKTETSGVCRVLSRCTVQQHAAVDLFEKIADASTTHYYIYIDMYVTDQSSLSPLPSSTPETCAIWCNDNDQCLTYVTYFVHYDCHVKSFATTLTNVQSSDVDERILYTKKEQQGYFWYPGYTCAPNDLLNTRNGVFVYDCASLCNNTIDCAYFSFEKTSLSGNCVVLKDCSMVADGSVDLFSIEAISDEYTTTTQDASTTGDLTTSQDATTTDDIAPSQDATTTDDITTSQVGTTTDDITTSQDATTTDDITTSQDATTTDDITISQVATTTNDITTSKDNTTTEDITYTQYDTTTVDITTAQDDTTTNQVGTNRHTYQCSDSDNVCRFCARRVEYDTYNMAARIMAFVTKGPIDCTQRCTQIPDCVFFNYRNQPNGGSEENCHVHAPTTGQVMLDPPLNHTGWNVYELFNC